MQYVNFNQNDQIYVFIQDHIQVGVIYDTKQKISLHITLKDGKRIVTSIVYAKCSTLDRLNPWGDLYTIVYNLTIT